MLQVACVRESLRLRAVVVSRLPLMANIELVYGDWVIPAKVIEGISTSNIYLMLILGRPA